MGDMLSVKQYLPLDIRSAPTQNALPMSCRTDNSSGLSASDRSLAKRPPREEQCDFATPKYRMLVVSTIKMLAPDRVT